MKSHMQIFECVQQPGEAMVVPNNWGHAVLNVETSVGVAMELYDIHEKTHSPKDLDLIRRGLMPSC